MEYPKLQGLYKREGLIYNEKLNRYEVDLQFKARKSKIIEGDFSCDEFDIVKRWFVTEKVDGMNVRIIYENGTVNIYGRTDKALFNKEFYQKLQDTFSKEKLAEVFPDAKKVVLFGEGYGGKIQSGGYYRKDIDFALFDVYTDRFWVNWGGLTDIASKLNIKTVPLLMNPYCDEPYNFIWNLDEIVSYVKEKNDSKIANEAHVMEGVVCRSATQMLFRKPCIIGTEPLVYADYHQPIMFKLRCEDFPDENSLAG
jgi:hypothetical protein